jgi:glutaminase
MSPPRGEADRALEPALVSTGSLPTAAQVEALVAEAHERYREDASGATSSVYPALARADPGLFGVCVIGMSGNVMGPATPRSSSAS